MPRLGKELDARQYLLSLQQNYQGNDDIAPMIEKQAAEQIELKLKVENQNIKTKWNDLFI